VDDCAVSGIATVRAMPAAIVSPYLLPILLLSGSNVLMTLAWYGHLSFKKAPLVLVIVVWGIAFVEYCMAAPANRWGNAVYTTAQLKTMQEVITLLVFSRVLDPVSEGADQLELRDRICARCGGRLLRFPRPALTLRLPRRSISKLSNCSDVAII
jgi:uncharacterized protein (DUF486 family)